MQLSLGVAFIRKKKSLKKNNLRTTGNPQTLGMTAEVLQASLSLDIICFHEFTIKALNMSGVSGGLPQKKTTKKLTAVYFKFARDHLDAPESCWNNILWTDHANLLQMA